MPYITNFEQMIINQAMKQEKVSAIELGLELKFGNEGRRKKKEGRSIPINKLRGF